MIDVTTAIAGARNYLESVFAADAIRNVRLEEVILSDDGRFWLVTFGFDRGISSYGSILQPRTYKSVKIDAESGQIRGVQIRELA